MISFSRITSDAFLMVWNISSAVTVLLPLLAFTVARLTTPQNWEEYQQQQQEQQNYNNQYQNDYQNPNNYDQYGNYVGPTRWWQFWKWGRNGAYYYEEDQRSQDEYSAPWWYIWGDREGREPEEEGKGAVLFVYLWVFALLVGLVIMGNTIQMTEAGLSSLRMALLGFANVCFVLIVLLVGLENAIETEGREMEETGFYGQRSVLLMLTCFFALIQSIVFMKWSSTRLNSIRSKGLTANKDDDVYVNVEDSGKEAGYSVA